MTMAAGTNTERVARLDGDERLATKAGLVELELSLTWQMARVETRMAQMETRMTWRMIGTMIGMSSATITAVALIVRFL